MRDLSYGRVMRFTVALAAAGALFVVARYGVRDMIAFLVGSGISALAMHSFFQLAAAIGSGGNRPITGSSIFLAFRYLLIAGAIYATMKVLGSSPAAIIVGLLVSFFAVILELLTGFVVSK
jgi:small-conductance mechanosensitive channel